MASIAPGYNPLDYWSEVMALTTSGHGESVAVDSG